MDNERKSAGTRSLVDLMHEDQNLREKNLKRAREYCDISGISKVIDEINEDRERNHQAKIEEVPIIDEGKVVYHIHLSGRSFHNRASIDIEVNHKGTIRIMGGWFASSTIEEEKWVKDPELINKALEYAYRHPA